MDKFLAQTTLFPFKKKENTSLKYFSICWTWKKLSKFRWTFFHFSKKSLKRTEKCWLIGWWQLPKLITAILKPYFWPLIWLTVAWLNFRSLETNFNSLEVVPYIWLWNSMKFYSSALIKFFSFQRINTLLYSYFTWKKWSYLV